MSSSASGSVRRRLGAPVALGALVLLTAAVGACTTSDAPTSSASTSRAAPTVSPSPGTPWPSTSPVTTPSAATPSGTTPQPPTIDPDPTYFTPSAGYSLSGPVTVEQALQDPFSNLLQRGALHHEPVSLDVVATPDVPVVAGRAGEILLGTCRCAQRGQGLHLTLTDGSGLTDAGGGRIAIKGVYTATQTAADAITLTPVG